jgi:hypothetical protein
MCANYYCPYIWHKASVLFDFGLQRHPTFSVVLGLMTISQDSIKEKALRYLLDHKLGLYGSYGPEDFGEIAFIPANRPDGSEFLAKHSEVRKLEAYIMAKAYFLEGLF